MLRWSEEGNTIFFLLQNGDEKANELFLKQFQKRKYYINPKLC